MNGYLPVAAIGAAANCAVNSFFGKVGLAPFPKTVAATSAIAGCIFGILGNAICDVQGHLSTPARGPKWSKPIAEYLESQTISLEKSEWFHLPAYLISATLGYLATKPLRLTPLPMRNIVYLEVAKCLVAGVAIWGLAQLVDD